MPLEKKPLDDRTAKLLAQMYTATDPDAVEVAAVAALLKAVHDVVGEVKVAEGTYVPAVSSPSIGGIKHSTSSVGSVGRSSQDLRARRGHINDSEISLQKKLNENMSVESFRGRVTSASNNSDTSAQSLSPGNFVHIPIDDIDKLEEMIHETVSVVKASEFTSERLHKVSKDIETNATKLKETNKKIQALKEEIGELELHIKTINLELKELPDSKNNPILRDKLDDTKIKVSDKKNEIKLLQEAIVKLDSENSRFKRHLSKESYDMSTRRHSKENIAHLIVTVGKVEVDGYTLKALYAGLGKLLSEGGFVTLKSIVDKLLDKIPENIREDLMISVLKNVQQQQSRDTKVTPNLFAVLNNIPNIPWRMALGYPVRSSAEAQSSQEKKLYERLQKEENPDEEAQSQNDVIRRSREEGEKSSRSNPRMRFHAFIKSTLQNAKKRAGVLKESSDVEPKEEEKGPKRKH